VNALRRGACPGIAEPMPTGDGLLARLMPPAPLALEAFAALCDASQAHGNGIMEVTQRGSLQVRGLSPDSATLFARTAAALGLGAEDRPAILASPLFGLDAPENLEPAALGAALRAALAGHPDAKNMGPKVSLLIDGSGALHLDQVPADLRLRLAGPSRWHLSLAGNAAAAINLGWVEPAGAVQAIARILIAIADRGETARARDFAHDAGDALRASLAGMLTPGAPPPSRPRAEPIGTHHLNDGRVACGIAPPFGYSEAGSLKRLAHAAAACGAASIRPAPGRALLFLGLTPAAADEFVSLAAADGWVVRPDDVRRHIVACAGAPACASALLSTRRLAPAIAHAAKSLLDGSITIHLSGCAKGCAHPGAAALTLVGPDRLVLQGRAFDAPQAKILPANFLAGLERLQAEMLQSRKEHSAQMPCAERLSRLGTQRLIESLGGESA
jgi:precorrin-3B synthase